MLKVASKHLGIGPKECMKLAENLYLKGYISYPRTESTQYPTHFDLKNAVKIFEDSRWGNIVKEILDNGVKPRKGIDNGDHPPITPVKVADYLEGIEGRLYEIITNYFLSSVYGDCKYKSTVTKFDINGEIFQCNGIKVIDPGFTKIINRKKMDNVDMPSFELVLLIIYLE